VRSPLPGDAARAGVGRARRHVVRSPLCVPAGSRLRPPPGSGAWVRRPRGAGRRGGASGCPAAVHPGGVAVSAGCSWLPSNTPGVGPISRNSSMICFCSTSLRLSKVVAGTGVGQQQVLHVHPPRNDAWLSWARFRVAMFRPGDRSGCDIQPGTSAVGDRDRSDGGDVPAPESA
jgi:hypothetical protein